MTTLRTSIGPALAGLLGAVAVSLGLALAGPSPALAQEPKAGDAPADLSLAIQRVTLDNGLRVVLNVDRTSPSVAVAVTYNVGSRNEQRGRSGFAHLFEHMMFQGSKNAPRGEHLRLISGHGGILDGNTTPDRTSYFESVPANELALALWLEADRMKSLDVSAESFETQRRVVQEEYRQGVSNAAYAQSAIRLEELVFQGYWPYEHNTIGSMADLDGARFEWARDFFAAHYGPDTAVLTVSGDFQAEEALALVRKYFDGVPRIGAAELGDTPFPEQTSQRTAVVKDDSARAPGVLYGWPTPPMAHADRHALEIAALLLGDGETSRLRQLLVRDRALAQGVSAALEVRRGPGLFTIDARLTADARVGDVERLIEGEIRALSTRGPSDAELARARRRARAAFVFGLQRNVARALSLSEYELFLGDARRINGELGRYLAVTKQDVQRVAREHLGPLRRTIVETYPSDAPAGPPRALKAAPVAAHPGGGRGDAAKKAGAPHGKKGDKAAGDKPAPKGKAGAKPKGKAGAKPKKK